MDPRSEVLLRHPALIQGPLLIAGLAADNLLDQLPQAHGWSWLFNDYQMLSQRYGARCQFGTCPPAGEYAAAVLLLPKSRELTDYLLASLAQLIPGKPLYLVGEKRAGIERAAKQLEPLGRPRKLDSARHCQLWQVMVEHSPAATLTDLAQRWSLALPGGPLEVVSLPGVFSHGRLDRGTALLLEHLDGLPDQGCVLDFGCGAGILGAALKRAQPAREVLMLDVDAFALESSRLTLAANGLEAQLITGSGIEAAPCGLAALVSNPPFHQGVHTDYRASETLLRQAKQHLRVGGELRLVANSFLNYPSLIEQHLGPCQTLAVRDGFHILRAVR